MAEPIHGLYSGAAPKIAIAAPPLFALDERPDAQDGAYPGPAPWLLPILSSTFRKREAEFGRVGEGERGFQRLCA
jgi:hypothetical protein